MTWTIFRAMALVLLMASAMSVFAANDVDFPLDAKAAAAASAKLTAKQKQDAKTMFSAAFDLFKAGEFDAAAIQFKKGLAIDPGNYSAHYYLAESLARLKDMDAAKQHYALTIELAPASKEAALAESRKKEFFGPSPGTAFRDCAECPEMVAIPAGSFEMGSPSNEAGRGDAEGPIHRVNVPAFALGRTHVTRGQFAAFVNETGYDAGQECVTFEGGKIEKRSGRNWRDPGYRQADGHAVVCVNWNDAKAYVDWLSRKTGKRYRLPTEAEWEYAARAGTTTARYWGESPDYACGYANVMDSTGKRTVPGVTWEAHNCDDGHAYTAPAGSFKPNAFGLYDMMGNAWQWLEDCPRDNYNSAPTDGSAWAGCGSDRRVLRGGSWSSRPKLARSAARFWFTAAARGNDFGFRPARMLP